MNSNLRERLEKLQHGAPRSGSRAAPVDGLVEPAVPAPAGTTSGEAVSRRKRVPTLETLLPGEEVVTSRGACWRHARPLDRFPGTDPRLYGRLSDDLSAPVATDLEADPAWRLWRERGLDAGLFLDLETTGLSATPVFLAGLLVPDGGALEFRVYLARDYTEEPALLEAVSDELRRRPVAVTYNGKSYDLPFLRERSGRLRGRPVDPAGVLDLLHSSRRRWGRRLPDCRLKTLEWHLCRRKRAGDIDGADIPATYHRFVRDRDPRPLIRIMTHNLLDLYTLAELTGHVARTPLPAH